jgi:hypothetical protein
MMIEVCEMKAQGLGATESAPLNALRIGHRSKWANNPECFDDKGRWQKGARMRVRSKRYRERGERKRSQLGEESRRRLVDVVLAPVGNLRCRRASAFFAFWPLYPQRSLRPGALGRK